MVHKSCHGREESGGDHTDSLEGGEISPQKESVDELPDTPDLLQYVEDNVLIYAAFH